MLFRTPPHINSLLSHLNMTFLNKGERSTKPASCICFCLALGKPALRESRSGYLPDFVKSASGPCKAGGELTTQVLCGCSHRGGPTPAPQQEWGYEWDYSLHRSQEELGQPPKPQVGNPALVGWPCSSSLTIPGQPWAHGCPRSSTERGRAGLRTGSAGSAGGTQLLTPEMLPLHPHPIFRDKAGEGGWALWIRRLSCFHRSSETPAGPLCPASAHIHPHVPGTTPLQLICLGRNQALLFLPFGYSLPLWNRAVQHGLYSFLILFLIFKSLSWKACF